MSALTPEPVDDPAWLAAFIAEHWGAPGAVSRGVVWTGAELKARRAMDGDRCVGVVSWSDATPDWQIVTLDALEARRGIGSCLLDAVIEAARDQAARRLWLITTNDNLDALRFYQRRGFRIVAVHAGAIAASRRIKPSIPEIGAYGIPIRDEIELEYPMSPTPVGR
ncbi:GNAT family N-acetyltransferase [Bauldia sp.]|uniref:GNAT family N-acetyltransferase n=1 Tax=Bauldia sp. TaxID=2575872 RepID=UPI003BAD65F0